VLSFHLWKIDQAFSSADGKVQFIELHDPANGEDLTSGRTIKSNEHTFTFPTNLSTSATADKHFLIGTTSYAALPGAVQPDYIVPDNFFNPSGDALNYADVDSFSFAAGQLPTDGVHAMFRDAASGALSTGANSETNLAGQTASITVSAAPHANLAPTLDTIGNPAPILPDSGQQTVHLTGIGAGAGETQNLTITAVSDNPSLVPNPAVAYTSPNSTGVLTYAPVAGAKGTATITVTVKDDGGTANGGRDTTTRTFRVVVGLTPEQVYAEHLVADVLGRAPSNADIQRFSGELSSGASRSAVAASVWNSAEHLKSLVEAMYQQLLGRAADDAALSFWTQKLSASGDESELAAGIAASDEYFARAGGDNSRFVAALYHDLLGRTGEATGLAFWQGLLGRNESRASVAKGFAGSHEFHGLLVDDPAALVARLPGLYQNYFRRPADAAGRSFFVGQLDAGASDQAVALEILASDEYFNRSA
jgi:hypothetical protein